MADLGPPSALSSLRPASDLHGSNDLSPNIPDTIRGNVARGRVATILPYRSRPGYGRQRRTQTLPVAIVENDRLRATFLTSLGGRLWSLFDKRFDHELLYQSPAIQLANLGLANAWFAGGVEWNISTIGHSPLSTEPLHVGRVVGPDGTPILRLYELERLRGTPFQLDIYLPDGSGVLYALVRIRNPDPAPVPVYWWSNIAVPERQGGRVLAPANDAFRFSYDGHLERVELPIVEGIDVSYPTNAAVSVDYFFDVPSTVQPWITAVDDRGDGLFHTSTFVQRGRKLFVWGQAQGGHRWQAFLSEPGHPYLEIQAGLAQTQLEHLEMPGTTEWVWLEAMGRIDLDPSDAHGSWPTACAAVDERLAELAPLTQLHAIEERLTPFAESPIAAVLQPGSGWGALEQQRRDAMGEPAITSRGTPFPGDSLGPDQAPWAQLLASGIMPKWSPSEPPPADVVGAGWTTLLEASLPTWLTHLALGVAAFAAGDTPTAREQWQSSVRLEENGWALRNLAILDRLDGSAAVAVGKMQRAVDLLPETVELVIELIDCLIDAGQSEAALMRIGEMTEATRARGRIRLLELRAALAVGDLARATHVFESGLVVEDLREGDLTLDVLWNELQARRLSEALGRAVDDTLRRRARDERPIPPEFDFRMGSG